jgi:hypothetical protein
MQTVSDVPIPAGEMDDRGSEGQYDERRRDMQMQDERELL